MQVVATAGHVDHGKSSLVRALTGTEPDRLPEERRRGLSIELGYASVQLPGVGDVAFVDVPGHERFIPTMLAGVGPVPAVLFVVAADDPWMPQAAEHLAALHALGVRHGVVAVNRSDLADPAGAAARAREELAGTSLSGAPLVPVSAVTGAGLDDLRSALSRMLESLPAPSPTADPRLWVDRRFSVAGTGTVVTGTLPAGTVRVGDRLTDGVSTLRVRGLQMLHSPADEASGTARVALALSGDVDRGSVLVAPDVWPWTDLVDVRVTGELPERPVVHVGTAAFGCRGRPLGPDAARLRLERSVPLRPGDRLLLRDPGSRQLWGAVVLDPEPPPVTRRGDATRRAAVLASSPQLPSLAEELRRRCWVSTAQLLRLGVDAAGAEDVAVRGGDWLLDRSLVPDLSRRVGALVSTADALADGVATAAVAHELGLPVELIPTVTPPDLVVRDGRVRRRQSPLPEPVSRAVDTLLGELARPFDAPPRDRLAALGLDRRAVAAAGRAGRLLVLDEGVVLAPGADDAALEQLSGLPQPFTASEARQALGTSRRVVLPLLDLLDRSGRTVRLPDDRRRLR
uniref:Selenocysteine-specific translation elongation factor n=1 Tax=uncultured Nocardioidaceae bacterium TaxID=253824 RepID=A0A6J4LVA5_9ACTN|nr:MAG: Selenocysteine-specific translation elongation factor [uncultured Nocardioidaceae bacterium]